MLKLNKYSLFIFLICILLLGTLVQTILPFNLNRMVGFCLFFLTLFFLLCKKNNFYILILSALSVTFSFLSTSDIATNLSNSIYWLIAIWLIYMSDDIMFQEKIILAFIREKKLIRSTIIFADLILLFLLVSGNGYKISFSERYFVGFTAHQHTMASAACFIMCLVLVDLYNSNKAIKDKFPTKHFLMMLPAIIAVLQSSARVFLIPAIIIIIYIYLYKIDKISIKLLILPLAVVVMGYLLINSNVFDRIVNISVENSDAYTSGRSVFWLKDIEAFLQSNFINKIFGHGFDYVQMINRNLTGIAIGAHNDYITLLLGLGLFGTSIYVWILIREIKNSICLKSLFKKVILFVFWFIPSFINGFYGYQLLLYSYIFFKLIIFSESNMKTTLVNVRYILPFRL